MPRLRPFVWLAPECSWRNTVSTAEPGDRNGACPTVWGARPNGTRHCLGRAALTACNDKQERAAAAGRRSRAHGVLATPVASTPPPASSSSTPSAPQVSGTPRTQVAVNQLYEFIPTARDPNGDRLAFSIAHRPAWLKFSVATGLLSGTPTAADVGVYRGITIAVSDGSQAKALQPFDIQVVAVGHEQRHAVVGRANGERRRLAAHGSCRLPDSLWREIGVVRHYRGVDQPRSRQPLPRWTSPEHVLLRDFRL